ncbi:MAG: ClpX C4-type zinc finger protein [Acidimicrobiales bacterium]
MVDVRAMAHPGLRRPLTPCSFCGKPRKKVKFVVAGPGVYICNACVDLCYRVIANERAPGG